MKVAVIGLGRLGLPLAVVLSSQGFKVIGIDIDLDVVDAVNARRVPERIHEPGLQELLDEDEVLFATTELEAAAHADVSIVMVPTPSEDDGALYLGHVLDACRKLGAALYHQGHYHVVVISSTVSPGSCDGPIKEILEKASGKTVGDNLGLCCCPEFVALGNVIEGFRNPSFVLVGESDPRAGTVVTEMYCSFYSGPIFRTSLVSAEIAKIGLNVAVVTKMAMAAQLVWMCQRYLGANANDVLDVIGNDPRIGQAFFSRILWPGGPCFPRDSRTLIAAAQRVGQLVPIARATDIYLRIQIEEMASLIDELENEPVAILGLTYKSGVADAQGSYGLALAEELKRRGVAVAGYDPLVRNTGIHEYDSLAAAIAEANILVVTVDHPEFGALEGNPALVGKTVVDCRQCLAEERIFGKYIVQGRGA